MAYNKQTWQNGEAGGTPISATRLNTMEDGIEAASETAADALGTATSASAVAQTAAQRATDAQSTASDAKAIAAKAETSAKNAQTQAKTATDAAANARSTAETALAAVDMTQTMPHMEFTGKNAQGAVDQHMAFTLTYDSTGSNCNNLVTTTGTGVPVLKILEDGVYGVDFAFRRTNALIGGGFSSLRNAAETEFYTEEYLAPGSWMGCTNMVGKYLKKGTELKFVLCPKAAIPANQIVCSVRITKFG